MEINARPACFFPKEQGVNYITVQGFKMSQAAVQWAPPTGVQKGLLGPNWSKGWIIEGNEISNAKCSGIRERFCFGQQSLDIGAKYCGI